MENKGKLITRTRLLTAIGVMLFVLGCLGWLYSTYPLGTQRGGAGYAGGQGALLNVEIPTPLRLSDDGIVQVAYIFVWDGQLGPDYHEDITITLYTSSFDSAPPSGQPLAQRVKEAENHQWIWLITPQRLGQQPIILQFSGVWGPYLADIASDLGVDTLPSNSAIMNTKSLTKEQNLAIYRNPQHSYSLTVPITVVDVWGFDARTARIMSAVVTFLGGGITISMLYELWQKWRAADRSKN